MVIAGTIFQHKNIHKTTWTSPDTQTRNLIDHITMTGRWRRTLQDVRAYRGTEIGSDHDLLVAKLRIKMAKIKEKNNEKIQQRFNNKKKLMDTEAIRDFVIDLKNRFQALSSLDVGSIEHKWERVKDAFTETCKDKLGHTRRKYKD